MSDSLFDLSGKTALITGSSRGIGLTLARGLGHAGATIILNGTDTEKLDKAVEAVSAEGLKAYGFPFDVTARDQILEKVDEIEKRVGQIDILVNNAGINLRGPLETIELPVWNKVIDVNLTGVFLTAQAVARSMISRRAGKIINVCSLMSELGRVMTGPYTASKGGVKMLTKAMATEWAKHNIQVNGIGPGYFLTDMTRVLAENDEFDSWIRSRTPAGRWGDTSELIGTAVFLASRASDFVNGQIIYVDGGLMSAI